MTSFRMKHGCSDDFRELLHVVRFDVYYVVGTFRTIHVPQIHPQIIRGKKCLSITAKRYRIYMICMRVDVFPFVLCAYHSLHIFDLWNLKRRRTVRRGFRRGPVFEYFRNNIRVILESIIWEDTRLKRAHHVRIQLHTTHCFDLLFVHLP
jgi:hypothetical protein